MRQAPGPVPAIDTAVDPAVGMYGAFNFRHRQTLRPFHALMAGVATEVLVDLGSRSGCVGGRGRERHSSASGLRALRRRARLASSLMLMASWR